MTMGGALSYKHIYRHAPITTPNSGNAAARRKTFTADGVASGKVWIQASVTVWVKFGDSSVDATGASDATGEIELQAGNAVPLLDTGGAACVSVYAGSDSRVIIQEVK